MLKLLADEIPLDRLKLRMCRLSKSAKLSSGAFFLIPASFKILRSLTIDLGSWVRLGPERV